MKFIKLFSFFVTFLTTTIFNCNGSVNLEEFFPFGPAFGDSSLPANDDSFVGVNLTFTPQFDFFNTSYTNLFINNNGAISFVAGVSQYTPSCGALTFPMIVPFWADVDTTIGGKVYYRESRDGSLLSKAKSDIILAFPHLSRINLGWLFITTWDSVPYYGAGLPTPSCPGRNNTNTFQVILGSDGFHSFTLFYYNKITWTTGTASGGSTCDGTGGTPAKAGFDYGDRETFYVIPGSCSNEIINITQASNIGRDGKWVFRIDQSVVSGGCDEEDSGTVLVRTNPTFVSQLGHVPIHIMGACLPTRNDSVEIEIEILCKFYDDSIIEVEGFIDIDELTEENGVFCNLPYFTGEGRIKVDVVIKHDSYQRVYETYLYVGDIGPDYELNFTITNNSTGSMSVVWDPNLFSMIPSLSSLNLVLVEYINGDWIERGILAENIANSGVYNGIPQNLSILQNVDSFFVVYLKPVGVTRNPVLVRFVFSRLILPIIKKLIENHYDQKCNAWYWTDSGTPRDVLDVSCPRTLEQARNDQNFIEDPWYVRYGLLWYFHPGADTGFRQRTPSSSGGGQQCVYKNGAILLGPPGGGTADVVSPANKQHSHFDQDVLPWLWCCKLASDAESNCRKYYEKRPSDSGEDYVPPRPGNGGGDPHITTFDLFSYTFNGVGEFWMIKSQMFAMQARMEQFLDIQTHEGMNASIFTAFSIRQEFNGQIVNVQISLNSGIFLVELDQIEVDLDLDELVYPILISHSSLTLTYNSVRDVTLTFTSGLSFRFTTNDGTSINLASSASDSLKAKNTFLGLLGNFDGDDSNELTTPQLIILPKDSSLQEIHTNFGDKWRTLGQDSLFVYELGKGHEYYQNTEFRPSFDLPDLSQLPPNVVETCGTSMACLYDYVNTGSLAFANGTAQFEKAFEQVLDIVEKEVVMCKGPEMPSNGYFSVDNYLLGANLTFHCNEGYVLVGQGSARCVILSGSSGAGWDNDVTPRCTKAEDLFGAAVRSVGSNFMSVIMISIFLVLV